MKKLVVMLLCCGLFLSGCGQEGPGAYKKGAEALAKEDYTAAAENFKEAVKQKERLPEAYRGTGIVRLKNKEYEKAEKAFEKSLSVLGRNNEEFEKDVLLYLVEAQKQQGKTAEAAETCGKLLALEEDVQVYFMRGTLYLKQKDKEKASEDFKKVLELDDSYEQYLAVYDQYHQMKQDADGYVYLEKALQKEVKSPEDYYQQGRIYYIQSDFSTAKELLQKAQKEGYGPAPELLGKIYLQTDEVEKARTLYESCVDNEKQRAMAYNGLALCALAEDNADGALEYIVKGLECEDKSQEENLLYNEVAAYEKKLDFETAEEKAAAFLQKYPDNQEMKRELIFLQGR